MSHVELGAAGTFFGGGNHNIFSYGMSSLPDNTKVPGIRVEGSGYMLRYPGLRSQAVDNRNQFFFDRPGQDTMIATKIWFGTLTENLTQCLAFQLLMWQALEMEKAGIKLKANIHDSWITVVPEAQAETTRQLMETVMSTVPPWLEGLPVACEAKIGDDYTIC